MYVYAMRARANLRTDAPMACSLSESALRRAINFKMAMQPNILRLVAIENMSHPSRHCDTIYATSAKIYSINF